MKQEISSKRFGEAASSAARQDGENVTNNLWSFSWSRYWLFSHHVYIIGSLEDV
ncbi:hypothetical protein [Scytonema sp. PCC 10023]|uniref:hypothetical protein n=1 Tax=Scytonema sp. PCC 10023 TaxID=1680591 RepID=UPI0039C5CBE3